MAKPARALSPKTQILFTMPNVQGARSMLTSPVGGLCNLGRGSLNPWGSKLHSKGSRWFWQQEGGRPRFAGLMGRYDLFHTPKPV